MKIAQRIRDLEGFTGNATLYKLDPPIKVEPDYDGDFNGDVEFVIVSATVAFDSGAETYIFPSNKDGEVVDWGQLDGSFRGGMSHIEALKNAGYSIS